MAGNECPNCGLQDAAMKAEERQQAANRTDCPKCGNPLPTKCAECERRKNGRKEINDRFLNADNEYDARQAYRALMAYDRNTSRHRATHREVA